jgi:1-deoxy-D-xylulose 5-phosphate reductoisomerase
VEAFLAEKISFMAIPNTIEQVLSLSHFSAVESIEQLVSVDAQARLATTKIIQALC